jgi:phosphoribosyl-dephospho-CoA transferase
MSRFARVFSRMEWTVHDLLRLRDSGDFVSRGPVPEWVRESLSPAPWVVVRRAPMEGEYLPVGVRGESRSDRLAGFIHSSSIVEGVRPQQLSASRAWERGLRRDELPAMRALPFVHEILRASNVHWGPIGSVGLELATGVQVAHRTSDLDLIVRLPNFLVPPAITKNLAAILKGTEVRVDLLLETVAGAISFREYISGAPNLLLRSVNGPRLVSKFEI